MFFGVFCLVDKIFYWVYNDGNKFGTKGRVLGENIE